MVFCGKDEACQKNGKLKKGYREVKCKNGSVKYMTDSATKKKPATKTVISGKKEKAPVKRPAKKTVIIKEPKIVTIDEPIEVGELITL